ncbi:MAG: DUF3006 domain-containing protein [Clostridiales bacterium]|nr:DUF3006 domain-containing protein [Clostridiales bacterium]
MKFTVDRIEQDIAVIELENGETLSLPYALLRPLQAKEGDVLQLCIDEEETIQRRERVASLLKDIFQK